MSHTQPDALRPTFGWAGIFAFVIAHNLWAVRRRREMLSQACQRTRQRHQVLTPLLGGVLYAHLMGYLGKADPIYWAGRAVERVQCGR